MSTTTIVQWLIFRGVGHAQTGNNAVIRELPVVACGRTSWPGLVKYQPGPPKRICEECAVALAMPAPPTAKRQTPSAELPPPAGPAKPSQGSLF